MMPLDMLPALASLLDCGTLMAVKTHCWLEERGWPGRGRSCTGMPWLLAQMRSIVLEALLALALCRFGVGVDGCGGERGLVGGIMLIGGWWMNDVNNEMMYV